MLVEQLGSGIAGDSSTHCATMLFSEWILFQEKLNRPSFYPGEGKRYLWAPVVCCETVGHRTQKAPAATAGSANSSGLTLLKDHTASLGQQRDQTLRVLDSEPHVCLHLPCYPPSSTRGTSITGLSRFLSPDIHAAPATMRGPG